MSDTPKPPAAPNRPPPPTAEQIAASHAAQEPKPTITLRPAGIPSEAQTGTPAGSVSPAAPPMPVIPPARTALVAGDPLVVLDYDRGRPLSGYMPPQVVPVLNRPMDTAAPTMVAGLTIRRARDMSQGEADAMLSKIIADSKLFVEDFPHKVVGENAYALNFFRALITRQRTRTDAVMHGQELADDPVQAAQYLPPPEQFQLREIAQQALVALRIYHRALLAADVKLSEADRHTVDQVLGQLQLVLPSPG